MQASSDLVRLIVELATGVEPSHDDLGSADALLWVLVHRYPPAMVDHGYRPVLLEVHLDCWVVPGEVLINSIVDYFPDAMMECRPVVWVTQIHAWALSDRL